MQAADGAGVADMRAIGADEGIALAALDAADGQFVLVAELQPQLAGQRFDRGGRHGPGVGLGNGLGVDLDPEFWLCRRRGPLPKRLRQGDLGIGLAAALGLVIQLIHRESKTGFTHLLLASTRLFYGSSRGASGPGRRFRGFEREWRVLEAKNGLMIPSKPILGLMPRNAVAFHYPFGLPG
jgi:hypothetical protein